MDITQKKLPKRVLRKPSALLKLALADLERVEADPRYVVNMFDWHVPSGATCEVCLAGSVIAGMGASMRVYLEPKDFHDAATGQALHALDALRKGDIAGAFFELDLPLPDSLDLYDWDEDEFLPCYHEDRKAWWDAMLMLVGVLEAEGC